MEAIHELVKYLEQAVVAHLIHAARMVRDFLDAGGLAVSDDQADVSDGSDTGWPNAHLVSFYGHKIHSARTDRPAHVAMTALGCTA